MSTYTEDHLVEQPAIQLMRHELVRRNPALRLAEAPVVHGNIRVHGEREHLNLVNKMLAMRS